MSPSSVSPSQIEASHESQIPHLPPPSPSLGRRIVQIGAGLSRSIKPIAIGVLAVAGIITLITLPTLAHQPRSQQTATSVTLSQPQRFNPYTPRFMYNGLQLVNNGTAACVIETPLEREKACKVAVDVATKFYGEKAKKDETAISFREKGIAVKLSLGNVHKTMHLRHNPQKLKNFEAALKYVEDEVLSKPLPFQGSPSNTVAIFRKIHLLLSRDLPDTITPGQFRTQWSGVDSKEQTVPIEKLARDKLTDEEYDIFLDSFERLSKGEDFGQLSPEEMQVWNRVVYIPPGPDVIEEQMHIFAKELKIKLQRGDDPIDVASFAHTEIVRIHGFGDHNGKLARIVMQAILRHEANLDTVVIYSDDHYNKVTEKAVRGNREIFTDYLRTRLIRWTARQKASLDPSR